MRVVGLLMMALVALFGVTFALLNSEPVNIHYYFGTNSLPLSILLLVTLAIGSFLGITASFSMMFRVRMENRRLRRKAQLAEKEVANLRALPLQDQR